MQRLSRLLWLIITVILVAAAIAIAVSNEASITLYLWPFDGALTGPIWLVILSSFIIGGLLSMGLLWAQWLTIRTRLWRLQGKFNSLKTQLLEQQKANKAHKNRQVGAFHSVPCEFENGMADQRTEADVSKPFWAYFTLRWAKSSCRTKPDETINPRL